VLSFLVLIDIPGMAARDVPSAISPCGICRQVLREFCALNMPILLVASNYDEAVEDEKTILETTLDELLPHSFGPEHLELPRS
jgi:cytidine deaminase